MEEEKRESGEIEETSETNDTINESPPNPNPRTVKTKVPEIEIHLFRRGKGPIDVFKSSLGGWNQDQLEVLDICEKYGFKSVFAFNTDSGRGVPIRFNHRNGRSLITYRDGSVIYIDGEPKARKNLVREEPQPFTIAYHSSNLDYQGGLLIGRKLIWLISWLSYDQSAPGVKRIGFDLNLFGSGTPAYTAETNLCANSHL